MLSMEFEENSPDTSLKNTGTKISSTTLPSSTTNNSATTSSFKSNDENLEFLNQVRSALIKADRRNKSANRKIVKNQPLGDAIKLTKPLLIKLIKMAVSILVEEDTLLEIEPPVIVCGDIHGQYSDLLDIFERLGWPPNKRYLFMGDYVDRGTQSVDVMALLLYLKCIFPKSVYLLRGNHEVCEINAAFGFRSECMKTFDPAVWDVFNECFKYLSLAAVISNRIICISPYFETFEDLKRLKKPFDIAEEGISCDLLWSDPYSTSSERDPAKRGYIPNRLRKISFWFGVDAVEHFLSANDLDVVVRGHEAAKDGYTFHFERRVLTIFTAPHYCGWINDAAVLDIREDLACQVVAFTFNRPIVGDIEMEDNDKDFGAGTTMSCESTPKSATAEPWNEVTLREPVKSPFEKANTIVAGEKTSSSSESVEKVPRRKSKAEKNCALVDRETSEPDETATLSLMDALSTDTIPEDMMPPHSTTTIEEAMNVPVRQLTLEDLYL